MDKYNPENLKDYFSMEKIVLDRSKFEKLKEFYEIRTDEVEVPEFNDLLELQEGQIAIVKIKQLSLDDYLKSQDVISDNFKNIIDGIVAASIKKGEVEDEAYYQLSKISAMARYNVEIVRAGVIEPKLNKSDIIAMKDLFPNVIIRLASKIIELTNKGGLKKKSMI